MARTQRFKKRESDRSGFVYREVQLVDDDGSLVGPNEFDQPPPSKISLGGEGESSRGDTNAFYTSYTSNVISRSTQVLAATSQIVSSPSQADLNNAPMRNWLWITGSNAAITLTSNPQITTGKEGDKLSIECVGSSVTLVHSNGLALTGGKPFTMTSGSVICFYYTTSNNVWQETSRFEQKEI